MSDDGTGDAAGPHVVGPAAHAAQRSGRERGGVRSRPYPLRVGGDDVTGDAVVLAATRALLTVTTRAQVAHVLHTAVNDLGGGVLPARLAEVQQHALPVDVSVGVGEPHVVVVDPLSLAGMRLTHHLPALVHDALAAAARCDAALRQERRASIDPVTGIAARTQVGARLSLCATGDAVCMIDLDGFKGLNDQRGHVAGDVVLQQFGDLLRRTVRADDFCARYGGDEFVVVLAGAGTETARRRMQDVVTTWAVSGDHGTSASVGVAAVTSAGGAAALLAADAALYAAKRGGRNRVDVADTEHQEPADDE